MSCSQRPAGVGLPFPTCPFKTNYVIYGVGASGQMAEEKWAEANDVHMGWAHGLSILVC